MESNYNSNAVSRSGASGVMQLMPATARGLGVTDVFDKQNINGGAKYLASLYKKYDGDLELTLAGYNAGPEMLQNMVAFHHLKRHKTT